MQVVAPGCLVEVSKFQLLPLFVSAILSTVQVQFIQQNWLSLTHTWRNIFY